MVKVRLSGSDQVEAFFKALDHPLKVSMITLRAAILELDAGITEHIKWNAPSFCYGGDDRITFNLHRSGDLLLIFHRGAKPKAAKGSGRLMEDESGILEWPADDRSILRISGEEPIGETINLVRSFVRRWIDAAGD